MSSMRRPLGKGPFPSAPLAQPACHADDGSKIIFSVQGSHIVNDRGERILLKGFARPSLEWSLQGENLSEEDIKCMKSKWNANVIRLSLNQNYWFESAPVTETGSYKQIINAIVYYAIQNHMAVILDLHWTEHSRQSNMANRFSLLFWEQVAADYKDFGTVLFELFNEPKEISPNVWLNGDGRNHAGYQELYDTVRNKSEAQNICIVNGLDWGYDLSFISEIDGFLVQGTNIVYGSHPYNEKMKNFQENFQGVLHKYPLIMTEFGVNQDSYFPSKGYESVYKQILGFCDQYDVSYTAWAWWVEDGKKANAFPCIVKDWSGTPLNGGIFIQQDMQRLPGTEIK